MFSLPVFQWKAPVALSHRALLTVAVGGVVGAWPLALSLFISSSRRSCASSQPGLPTWGVLVLQGKQLPPGSAPHQRGESAPPSVPTHLLCGAWWGVRAGGLILHLLCREQVSCGLVSKAPSLLGPCPPHMKRPWGRERTRGVRTRSWELNLVRLLSVLFHDGNVNDFLLEYSGCLAHCS